ncbi:THAP domain-containing protein 6-like isoform X2 [Paramisgurnus dabryanus]|uniref:THAP domain-containing protein 6-like isoform X2 n=1 Tax=Paramisgurnus dabryanus TaxID=90735 RepID=UPI003CCF91F8
MTCWNVIQRRRHIDWVCSLNGERATMPVFCAAYGCNNRRTIDTKSHGITFHKFPKQEQLRKLWELSVRKKATVHSVLCSEHFRPEDFDRTGQSVRIREGVKPSVFSYWTRRKTQLASKQKQKLWEIEVTLPVDYSIPKKSSIITPPAPPPPPPKPNLDHIYAMPTSPAVLKARLHGARTRLENLQREVRNLKVRERRNKKTINDLQKNLRKKNIANRKLRNKLKGYSEIPIDLLLKKGQEYTQDQKEFALNLHLQGPKAYNYLRKVLHLDLPHPHTLQRWKSSADKPGPDTTTVTQEGEELNTQNVPILSSLEELQKLGVSVVWTMNGNASKAS